MISTFCIAVDALPAASETVQVISVIPDLNGPAALAVGVNSPSFWSTAEATPRSTAVIRPVAAMLMSAGIVNTGGNSSLVGSVPAAYSSAFVKPSPSKSVTASVASFGSKPLLVSKKSGIPSLSVSRTATVMLAEAVTVLPAASDTEKVTTVTPIGYSVKPSLVILAVKSPSLLSVAAAAAKKAVTASLLEATT